MIASHQQHLPGTVLTVEEVQRRNQRKFSYHLLGYKNKLPKGPDEEYEDSLFRHLTTAKIFIGSKEKTKEINTKKINETKKRLLRELASSNGDMTTPTFLEILDELSNLYDPTVFDARKRPQPRQSNNNQSNVLQSTTDEKDAPEVEGMWISLSKPIFEGELGCNEKGELLYHLGRMSFGMFQPANLVCSIQGTFNPVHLVRSKDREKIIKEIPDEQLRKTLQDNKKIPLRTYKVVTAFTIEASNPDHQNDVLKFSNIDVKRPIEGLMTTNGFVLPDNDHPNRLKVYFYSGSIEVDDLDMIEDWRAVFASYPLESALPAPVTKPKEQHLDTRPTKKGGGILGKIFKKSSKGNQEHHETCPEEDLASSTITMEDDGKMTYHLPSKNNDKDPPYLDVLYFDETLRISRSNGGPIYVMARVPNFKYD